MNPWGTPECRPRSERFAAFKQTTWDRSDKYFCKSHESGLGNHNCKVYYTGPGFDPGRRGRFSDGGEKQKRPCVEISTQVKDPQVVEINPEPSATARLITSVVSAR